MKSCREALRNNCIYYLGTGLLCLNLASLYFYHRYYTYAFTHYMLATVLINFTYYAHYYRHVKRNTINKSLLECIHLSTINHQVRNMNFV